MNSRFFLVFLVFFVLGGTVFATSSNNIFVSGASFSPADLNASKTSQTVLIDVNAGNFFDSVVDVNARLFFEGALVDSNSVSVDVNSYKIIRFIRTIDGGTYGEQDFLISVVSITPESDYSDNNFLASLVISKFDVNVFSVSPHSATLTLEKGRPAIFDVTVLNNGTSAKNVNLLFYAGGILVDSNLLSVSALSSKIFSFTKIFSDFNNDLNFVVLPVPYEYEPSDNNYFLHYDVIPDKNDAVISDVSFSNTLYSGRQFKDTNVLVGVTVDNNGTGNFASDMNVRFFVNGAIVDSNVVSCIPGDSNIAYFTRSFSSTGDYNFVFSVAPLPDEISVADNNYSSSFVIDGNAVALYSVLFSTPVYKDTNQKIDSNVTNYGPTSSVTLRLFDRNTGAIVSQSSFQMSHNDSNWITLYTGLLTSAVTRQYTISVANLENEYLGDNNFSFNMAVSNPSSTENNDTTTVNNSPNTVTDTNFVVGTKESNSKSATAVPDFKIISEIGAFFSSAELQNAEENTAGVTFVRKMVNLAVTSSAGVITYKTRVTISISKTFSSVKDFNVVEVIPKTIASDASKITSSIPFRVLKSDPIIEFIVSPGQDIIYDINSTVDTNKISDFNTPLITKITLEEATPQNGNENASSGSNVAADQNAGQASTDFLGDFFSKSFGLTGISSDLGWKIALLVGLIIAAIFIVFRIFVKKKKLQGVSSIKITKSKILLPRIGSQNSFSGGSGQSALPEGQASTASVSSSYEPLQQKPFAWKPVKEKKNIFGSLRAKINIPKLSSIPVPSNESRPESAVVPPSQVAEKIAETALENNPSSFPSEFNSVFDAMSLAEAKLNSIGATFSRKMVAESYSDSKGAMVKRTKIIIRVKRSFLKETKSISVVEYIPKEILQNFSNFSSSRNYRIVGGNVLKFTVGIDDDIEYYISGDVGVNKIVLFKSPLITKII
ncbi:MAG: hypothetical protein WC308_02115 [archaeon]|jgi:hypothetical protein